MLINVSHAGLPMGGGGANYLAGLRHNRTGEISQPEVSDVFQLLGPQVCVSTGDSASVHVGPHAPLDGISTDKAWVYCHGLLTLPQHINEKTTFETPTLN